MDPKKLAQFKTDYQALLTTYGIEKIDASKSEMKVQKEANSSLTSSNASTFKDDLHDLLVAYNITPYFDVKTSSKVKILNK